MTQVCADEQRQNMKFTKITTLSFQQLKGN